MTACTDIALQQFDSEAKTLHSFAGYSFHDGIFLSSQADGFILMSLLLMKSQCYHLSILKKLKRAPKLPVETIHPWEAFKSLAVETFSSFPTDKRWSKARSKRLYKAGNQRY